MVLAKQLNVIHNKDMPIILIQQNKEVYRGTLEALKNFCNLNVEYKNAFVGDINMLVVKGDECDENFSRITFNEPLNFGIPYLIIKIKSKVQSEATLKEVK